MINFAISFAVVVKWIYKILRSILFSATLLIVGGYVIVYSLVSIPAFSNFLKNKIASEVSNYLGAQLSIDKLEIFPFNEARISGIKLYDPQGNECVEIQTLGAGISLWKLISEQKIELSYAEIIGLKAYIVQNQKDEPLNIDFLIKAFEPKQENKQKNPFELALKNVVLRKSYVSFSRPWLAGESIGNLPLDFLQVNNIAADIIFPEISDKGVKVDLRRLSLDIIGATDINNLSFVGEFSSDLISVENLNLQFPNSSLSFSDIRLKADKDHSLAEEIKTGNNKFQLFNSYITPSDFSFIFPPLSEFTEKLDLAINFSGNSSDLEVTEFSLKNPDLISINLSGEAVGLDTPDKAKFDLNSFSLFASHIIFQRLKSALPALSPKASHIIENTGDLSLTAQAVADLSLNTFSGNLKAVSQNFDIEAEGEVAIKNNKNINFDGELILSDIKLQHLLPEVPLSNLNANVVADVEIFNSDPKLLLSNSKGVVNIDIDNFDFKGKHFDGLSLNIEKDRETFVGDLFINNQIADAEAKFNGIIEAGDAVNNLQLDMDIRKLDLSQITNLNKYSGYLLTANLNLDAQLTGNDFIDGQLNLTNFSFYNPVTQNALKLRQFKVTAQQEDKQQSVDITSDWFDARAQGDIKFHHIHTQVINMVASVFPDFFDFNHHQHYNPDLASNLEFDILVKKNNTLPEFFNLPVRLLVPLNISGTLNGGENTASFTFDLPYLQQGKDKLIYDTKLVADINGNTGIFNAIAQTTVPVKRGDLALNIFLYGNHNSLSSELHWINTENPDFKGKLELLTDLRRNPFTHKPEIELQILPTTLNMGPADWNVSKTDILIADKNISINNLKVWHDDQLVEVAGVASPRFEDHVDIILKDIDVDYIFDMLQINYVTFGGTATGEISGRALLSSDPAAETEYLQIKDFKYNGASLGECIASSKWNNEEKKIEISADIFQNDHQTVKGTGGIWLGRDSLSFNLLADKVPVDFVQPFMAVFSSHVGGYATGDVNLYGTFHDIDMTGKIFADSVAVKLDYTNTVYHGSDSVLLYPGRIEIPSFRLYDKFNNSALLIGELTHRYFHDPSFNFRLLDANNFLCYDTNSDLNPDWYGILFGSGSANLRGVPGNTEIFADMTVAGNSNFTFVLSDSEYARDYKFLTFSDKKAEQAQQNHEITAQDIKEMLRQKMAEDQEGLSRFSIDLRATVLPQVLFTLIMDPAAGDKITARGTGALQLKYESDSEDISMYGKYEIQEGNYNFSLQDIILRDFKIKEGSYIAFNGNPINADLDISATYRVNTNLSDLDKSFSTDRDLNRTNVPVDAVLSVTGEMTNPDITFDIELPTLTQDVERKVKSIISTDDMMNRQIIYLLALNRFYTPEYMGNSGNGGELAAVASSTISSQLSNILGQLTDKLSVSPSFRSDKGDFSDIEVDVALSSRLLNNRLLINGNFGYRDRTNSSTTFVGDFDVEYLLSKKGNLRLKAYNHFNDQNYYLREALTTQGLGIVYRKDFDNWFTFLKKRKKNNPDDAPKD